MYKHIETFMFHFKKRLHNIDTRAERKRNLTRGIDLSSLYPILMTFLEKQNKKI